MFLKRVELYSLHLIRGVCLSQTFSSHSAWASLKHLCAQRRSSTLTSQLAHAVKFLSIRQHGSCTPRHLVFFPCLCWPAPRSFQVTVRKTWMKGWNYSPSISTTDRRACLVDSGLHACGHILRDLPGTRPSPQRTRALRR